MDHDQRFKTLIKLGVALSARMKIPGDKAAWLGAEALRKIQEAPLSDQQRFLLGECIQAYLPLDERQQAEFEKLFTGEPYKGVLSMNKTYYEKGIEKGIEKARREVLRELLEVRFGPMSAGVKEKIEPLAPDRLKGLTKAVLHAASLEELGLED